MPVIHCNLKQLFLLTGLLNPIEWANQPEQGTDHMTMIDRLDARRTQMLRELQSDMADLVEAGELTAEQANEWVNSTADRWAKE